MLRIALLVAAAATVATALPNYAACENDVARKQGYCDLSLSHEQRVQSLLASLTLEEKIKLIAPDPSQNTCNMHTSPIDRIGLPEYMWLVETNTAVAAQCYGPDKCATNFIGPEGLGASFNRTLWFKKGDVISTEMRALSNADWMRGTGPKDFIGLDGFGPNINIVRDPRFGRNSELPGEDPLLSGSYAAEYVKGMQQVDQKGYMKMVAYLKHFDAYSVEKNRGFDTYNISRFDFYDTYLAQYKIAFTEGGASGVMCSYNAENGVPSCANGWLLNEVMRGEWNQKDAVVMSDCGAVPNLMSAPAHAPNEVVAAAWAINNGTDLEAGSTIWTNHLYEAVRQGLVNESVIDAAVRRTQLQLMRAGRFDPPSVVSWTNISTDVVNSTDHRQVNYEAALQSFVLLKNENRTLPLQAGKQKVAVVGPQAVARYGLLSDYCGDVICYTKDYACIPTIGEEMALLNGADMTVVVEGVQVSSFDDSGIAMAVQAAKQADVVVLALGIDKTIEYETHDRDNLTLPGIQEQFAMEILALNKPTILILTNGGSLAVENLLPHTSAVIEAFNPATEGARALAATVFGRENRWGKMPYTIYPAEYIQQVQMTNFDMALAPGRTYRYYTGNATFPFGFGLSMTEFRMSCIGSPALRFGCYVANYGHLDGDEVVMVFHSAGDDVRAAIGSTHPVPIKQLVAFDRVRVGSHGATPVAFHLDIESLKLTDADGAKVLYDGSHTLTFSRGHGHEIDFECVVKAGQIVDVLPSS